MDANVIDNPEASRYELYVDGQLAGLIDYRIHNRRISMVHTEIGDEFGGQGLGARLARGALEDARNRGLEVVPLCPFVAAYVGKHRDEYLELVAPAFRERITSRV